MYYTYSGILRGHAAPTIENVAICLCRESRYTGNGRRWWNVGLHSFVVADLLPDRLKVHGLLHDEPETVTGDIPKDQKSKKQRKNEDVLLVRFYNSVGLRLPTEEEHALVKAADLAAVHGEIYAGAGTECLQQKYDCNPGIVKRVEYYMDHYRYSDCLEVDGQAVLDFIERFRLYKAMATR